MLFAKVVTGLAVEGPFDYIVPPEFTKKIKIGSRVRVNFRNREIIGYCVGLTRKTNISKLKTISQLLDNFPVLDKGLLSLTKDLSEYYCCSWGEAIEASLPQALRRGKRISYIKQFPQVLPKDKAKVTLLHDLDGEARWDVYLAQIKNTTDLKNSAIVLLPDINSVFRAKEKIIAAFGKPVGILFSKQLKAFEEWLSIKNGEVDIVVGTRSAVFAPLKNLGLVIVDEEEDSVYKQDQVPHYNARDVAFMRINLEKAELILGSGSPSLESFYLAKKNKIKYVLIPRKLKAPEIKIYDNRLLSHGSKRKDILSKYVEDSISCVLNSGGKTLIFLNRKGFATYSSCSNCGATLKCGRCNINLVFHFKDNVLKCHYCNFKLPAQTICPACNSGYIRYLGAGTERIESELFRIFPQAKIKLLDKEKKTVAGNADIFVSTESVISGVDYNFDLIVVLSIDNSLNRVDLRSSEKAFGLLAGLLRLSDKKVLIQTGLPAHHCFAALKEKNIDMFYDEELRQRKQLEFPPYRHICLVKLRAVKEDSVRSVSQTLFDRLSGINKNKNIEFVCVNAASPSKLRGNYCWQILIKTTSCRLLSRFLKIHLKTFSHSGIIVTVDIDPI